DERVCDQRQKKRVLQLIENPCGTASGGTSLEYAPGIRLSQKTIFCISKDCRLRRDASANDSPRGGNYDRQSTNRQLLPRYLSGSSWSHADPWSITNHH